MSEMNTSVEKALYYSATARRALRDAEKQKLQYRYPECIIRAQESIEFAGKAMLEFMGIRYDPYHYVGDKLEKIGASGRRPDLKEDVARAIVYQIDGFSNLVILQGMVFKFSVYHQKQHFQNAMQLML